ncbi:MAG: hypothetical protein P4L10_17060 [Acidobacteriaceae bacterium]|nr:hypothetical protein [Acidobacteriaceae bacterium]
MKNEIANYGRKHHKLDITLKYIDPSYLLRAVPANSSDKYLCAYLLVI